MQVQARSKYLKISAKKMRLVAVTIKGMDVSYALDYLKFFPHKASPLISKTLHSAIANAEHNFNLDSHNLFVKRIFADEGTMLKRWRARAFGRATPIHKKSSHLTIILEERVPSKKEIKTKDSKLQEPSILKTEENLQTKEEQKKELKDELKDEIKESGEGREQEGKYRKEQNLKRAQNKSKAITLKKIFRRKSI